jgi:hypothetical protein
MVVPRLGGESMETLPFTSFSRFCMRLRPSPWPFLPLYYKVEAHTVIADREMNLLRGSLQLHIELPHPAMFHFTALCRASCSTRKRQRVMSGITRPGKS